MVSTEQKLRMKDFIEEYYEPLNNNELLKTREERENTCRSTNRIMFERDYSRILYSSSFRRLQGKMQLFGVESDSFFRNRLTHSLEVSQIARGIVNRLREISGKQIYEDDLYVIEAASLAHDIGNPPFGHHGERVLNKIMENNGGFEGNAQTFRVLYRLEKKLPNKKGLNLTNRTLFSVIKYFKKYCSNKNSEKFLYDQDFNWVENTSKKANIYPRTIDVQIMDLADEIAYGTHDLEDALSLHLFSIDEFLYEFKKVANKKSYEFLRKEVERAQNVAFEAKVYNSSEEYAFLFRKELVSNIVHQLILDIDVISVDSTFKEKTGTLNEEELGFKELNDFVTSLKKVTFKSINRSNIVQVYEKQGEKVIKGLFEAFMDKSFNTNKKLLPIEYRGEDRKRDVTDYIAGMMDSYALNVYKDIYGEKSLDKIYNPYYFKDYCY